MHSLKTDMTQQRNKTLTLLAMITQISMTAREEWANCGEALLYVMKILIFPALLTLATSSVGVLLTIPHDGINLCFPSYSTLEKTTKPLRR